MWKPSTSCNGSTIKGDIISDYDDLGRRTDRTTEITFGLLADAAGRATSAADSEFRITIDDAILGYGASASARSYDPSSQYTGRGKIDLRLAGGITALGDNSQIMVNRLAMDSGAGLKAIQGAGGRPIAVAANHFNLGTGSTVDYYLPDRAYFPGQVVLQLVRLNQNGEFVNLSTATGGDDQILFTQGIYDYQGFTVSWDSSGQLIDRKSVV